MPIRWNLMLVATLLTIVSVGCGSNATPRPTPTVALAPTAAPPTTPATPPKIGDDPLGATRAAIAASPVLRAPGWLIYLRGNDLYAGDLLTGNEIPLTVGSVGGGYAGRADIAGKKWLYYTSLGARTPGTATQTFAVYRRPLGASNVDEEELFEFTASDRYLVDFSTTASVEPDGRHVVYTDDAGLHLYDIESHNDRLLVSNELASPRDTPGNGSRGNRYSDPVWSPAGGWLSVISEENRWPYNRIAAETIRPLDSSTEYKLGGRGANGWSPDGQHLCGDTSQTAATGIGLLTPGSTEILDLTPNLFDNLILRPTVDSCAWAEDGRLAVGYDTDGIKHFIIAILDISGRPTARIDAGAVWPHVDYWLPDRTGFVIATLADPSSFNSAAIMLDGTYRRLPFDAEKGTRHDLR